MSGSAAPPYAASTQWPVHELGKLCIKIGSGATPTGGEASYLASRQVWALVRSQNVFDRRFDANGLAFISNEQAQRLGGVVLAGDEVLLNITGDGVTFGRACRIPPSALPAVVNQHVSIVRPRSEILDPEYLLAYLTHPLTKHYIEGFNAGGSRRAITKAHIESFQVPVPPLAEQRAIASQLEALDKKTEQNRRMSETLEAIAWAVFKSWFVDFEPVRAKAAGESSESIGQRLGMTEETLSLFAATLLAAGSDDVPAGWKRRPLTELTSYLSRGVSPKYVESGGVLVLNQKCIRDQRVSVKDARRHDPMERAIQGRELAVGDVLVNSTGVGTLGRVGQLMSLEETAIVDSHITVVRADLSEITANYLGMALCDRQAEIEALGEGSTGQTELSRARLGAMSILAPPVTLLAHFDERTAGLRQAVDALERESQALARTRDALLPRLLCGELRVGEEVGA